MYQSSDRIPELTVAMNTIQHLCRPYFKMIPGHCLRFFSISSIFLIALSGCDSPKSSSKLKTNKQSSDLEAINSPSPLDTTPTKLKLVLDAPESLRVKQGDLIVKEQILVDRSAARQQIKARRLKIQQAVALLPDQTIQIVPANKSALVAEVKQARERVRLAEAAIQDFLAKSPYTDFARQKLPLPAEEKRLAQLQLAKSNAQAQLVQVTNQLNALQSAQTARQQTQADSSSKKQQLLNELKTIDSQLQSLQDVLSPHDAIIQGIEWQKKGKNGTVVELDLAVHSFSDPIPSTSSTPNNPLLPSPNAAPALPTGPQSFPSPSPSSVPASPIVPQARMPIQQPTASSN